MYIECIYTYIHKYIFIYVYMHVHASVQIIIVNCCGRGYTFTSDVALLGSQ